MSDARRAPARCSDGCGQFPRRLGRVRGCSPTQARNLPRARDPEGLTTGEPPGSRAQLESGSDCEPARGCSVCRWLDRVMALGGDTSALTESTRVGPRRILAPAVALAWVLALTILPIALWHRVLDDIVASSNWSFSYVAELSPWFLLLAGVAFLFPVAISAGSSPE